MRSEISPTIQLATAAEIIPLRSAILRDGLPLHFDADNAPATLHGGAFVADICVGAATFLREPLNREDAYRLRGMAVDPAYQQKGIGRALLEFLLKLAAEKGVEFFWCNARVPAVPFYQRLGWKTISDIFDIPEAGPHYRMSYRIKS